MNPALLDTSKLIVGATGSGKTVTAKAEVAELLGQRRHVCIIDPTGVWWGMRAAADGEQPGFDLPIFGGAHGDVPIRPDQGAAIARIVVEQRVSAIVDLSTIDTSRDWRLFMRDFVAQLRRRPRGNFHFVVDEADEFAAERAIDDIGFALREDLVWIAKRGRVAGFVPTWITQRTAEIAKAVISQAQTIVAHQLIAPSDRKAIDDYLKGHGTAEARREVMASLAGLGRGERWVYSPALGILERGVTPPLATFDSSRTPEPGEIVTAPRTLAELDVSAIAAALAPAGPYDLIPADPAEGYAKGTAIGAMLRERDERIAELERENAELDEACDRLVDFVGAIEAAQQVLLRRQAKVSQAKAGAEAEPEIAGAVEPVSRSAAGRSAAAASEAMDATGGETPPSPPAPSSDGPAAAETEFRALAGLAAVFPSGLTEAAWAARTGYSRKGGAWLRRRKRYLDDHLIELRGDRWFATDAGVARAGGQVPDMPSPGTELVDWWAARLGAPGRILKLLAAVHPRALSRDAVAARLCMSVKGGAFNRYVTDCKVAELIVESGKRLSIAPALLGEERT